MTDHTQSSQPAGPFDELATQLLECGAVLSQVVSHMVQFEASGRSAPDAAPVPEVAHDLVSEAIAHDVKQFSKADIVRAAEVVEAATDAIHQNIFFVPFD